MDAIERASPRIPIDSCHGLFEKLKWDLTQLELGWDEYRTFNFVVTAYHLYMDWIKNAGSVPQKERKGALPPVAQRLFDILRDVTNASKHWQLYERNRARQIVDDVSVPLRGDWHSYFVAGPVIYVSVGNSRLSMPVIASLTIECFEWILNGQGTVFPSDLSNSLESAFDPLAGRPENSISPSKTPPS